MPSNSRTRVYVTRHGLSEHNLNTDVFMGRSPASRLTDEGRAQARLLGARLAREAAVTWIAASSLPRTMETAELIADEIGQGPPRPEEAFWELDKGSWEGAMPRELPPEVAAQVAAEPFTYCYGGAESYSDVVGRVARAFDRWVAEWRGECILFVLHGDVIRALLYHLIRFPQHRISDFVIDPCSISEFHSTGEGWEVVRLNDASHLA
jgi:broad specificity phosphatase PhoE